MTSDGPPRIHSVPATTPVAQPRCHVHRFVGAFPGLEVNERVAAGQGRCPPSVRTVDLAFCIS
jgi:hypothetical protein